MDVKGIKSELKDCMLEYRKSQEGVEDKHLHFLRIMEKRLPIFQIEKPKKRRTKKAI